MLSIVLLETTVNPGRGLSAYVQVANKDYSVHLDKSFNDITSEQFNHFQKLQKRLSAVPAKRYIFDGEIPF